MCDVMLRIEGCCEWSVGGMDVVRQKGHHEVIRPNVEPVPALNEACEYIVYGRPQPHPLCCQISPPSMLD